MLLLIKLVYSKNSDSIENDRSMKSIELSRSSSPTNSRKSSVSSIGSAGSTTSKDSSLSSSTMGWKSIQSGDSESKTGNLVLL